MQNFNVAVPFPSGACGSLGCHSVASPPRGRPWRLSPLVVQWIISMSVIAVLLFTFSNANGCSCISLYYVLILLVVLLYRTLRPMIFIPRFAEIWGPTFICGSARALYRALVRPEGRAFFSQYGEPAKLCQDEPATTSSARFISTSDAVFSWCVKDVNNQIWLTKKKARSLWWIFGLNLWFMALVYISSLSIFWRRASLVPQRRIRS